MLIISGGTRCAGAFLQIVSISQSRCLSFQAISCSRLFHARQCVSISQSRCLSFQGKNHYGMLNAIYRFNLAIEMLIISGTTEPSVTKSKGTGFNLAIEMLIISGRNRRMSRRKSVCFNLAIEMLIISGIQPSSSTFTSFTFQSRNRDAYHFRALITPLQNRL